MNPQQLLKVSSNLFLIEILYTYIDLLKITIDSIKCLKIVNSYRVDIEDIIITININL